MKKFVEKFLEIIGIATVVTFGWQILELLMTGKINPNKVDTIVGLILISSLYLNLVNWKSSK